jgi:hypothetical protein
MAANTSTGTANSVVVNVYGTLNVKATTGTGTTLAQLALVNDSRSGQSNSNSATVNIHGWNTGGGLVDVDGYTIGKLVGGVYVQYGVGKIKLWGGARMKIKGRVLAQVNADIGNSRIVAGGNDPVRAYVKDGNTYIVPEPATIAMLGLGGLLLCRKKR